MQLKFNRKYSDPIDGENLSEQLEHSVQKNDFFQKSVRTLLQFVQDFSLDLKDIRSDEFKLNVSKLSDIFEDEKKLAKIRKRFAKDKRSIADYIDLHKKYLGDRECEFKDIIEILTKAMVTLDSENRQYNRKLLQQTEKFEQITFLDDIKKIKQALIQEIEQIRETVKKKQSRDSVKLDSLSKQVEALNSQLEKARTESVTDGLTGIYNRKAFDERIDKLVKQNAISRSPFSLLMLDIDDFKKINDNHGHQTGDRVIMAVINKCRQSIRSGDFLARYGGEEFALIMPGASLKNAVKKANAVCKSVAATRYCLDDVPGSPTLSVTISIGVSYLEKADTATAITQRADKALYAAKTAGKNCVFSELDAA